MEFEKEEKEKVKSHASSFRKKNRSEQQQQEPSPLKEEPNKLIVDIDASPCLHIPKEYLSPSNIEAHKPISAVPNHIK